MHVLLDHISSFLVAGILFIAVFTMMHRNRQSAVEMTVNQMVNEQAYEFLKIIERDVENMRSMDELNDNAPLVDTLCSIVDTTLFFTNPDGSVTEKNRTTRFTFPTLEGTVVDTLASVIPMPEYVSITYEMIATGKKAMVNGNLETLFRVDRLRQEVAGGPVTYAGTSGDIITNFSVRMFNRSAGEEECADKSSGATDGGLAHTLVEFEAASPISFDFESDLDANDVDEPKKSRSNLNATRYGATIYSPNR